MPFRRQRDTAAPASTRRWPARLLVLAGVALALTAILWTGLLQAFLVRRAAENTLGTPVALKGLALLGDGRADEILVYGRTPAAGEAPFLRLEGVTVDYSLIPSGGRRIDSITVDALTVHADGSDPRAPNYRFIEDLLRRPRDNKGPSPFLPRSIRIRKATVEAGFTAMDLRLDGLQVDARFDDAGRLDLSISGEGLAGSWNVETYGMAGEFDDGRVNLELAQQAEGFSLAPMDVHLPGLAEINGTVTTAATGANRSSSIDLARFTLNGLDLSHADPAFLPFPVRFAHLDASGTRLRVDQTPQGVFIPEAEVSAVAKALAVGLAGREWYEGDLTLRGSGHDRRYTAEATLGQGQRVALTAQGTPLAATGTLKLEGWSREQVINALPKAYRARADSAAALQGLSADLAFDWKRPAYAVKGTLSPVLADEPGVITVDGSGSVQGAPVFDGTVHAALGDATAAVQAKVNTPDRFTVDAELQKADLHHWLSLARPLSVPPRLLGIATGKVSIVAANDLRGEARMRLEGLGTHGDVTADVTVATTAPSVRSLRPFAAEGTAAFPDGGGQTAFDVSLPEGHGWKATAKADALDAHALLSLFSESLFLQSAGSKLSGDVAVTADESGAKGTLDLSVAPTPIPQILAPAELPLTAKGAFKADADFARITGKTLEFASPEDVAGTLKDWTLTRKGLIVERQLEATLPAARIASLRKLEEISGVLTGSAPIKYAEGLITAQFDVTGEEFGVGRYAAPPGLPMAATGNLRYNTAKREGLVNDLVVRWSEPTEWRFEPMTITAEPGVAETPYTLRMDLAPLVYWGLVQDAEGTASATGTLAYGKDGFALRADYTLAAPSMVLSGKTAVLGGLASQGRLAYARGFSGSGRFGAATVTAAGATVHDAVGPFTIADGVLKAENLQATLWKGALRLDEGTIDFRDPALPIVAKASVEDLDLATFTEEYKPPKARLTGLGGGTVTLLWNREGIGDLEVALKADKDLTVNRDLVYQLLMSQYIKDAQTGKRVDRIVNDVVGEADQRPFSDAAINLEMGSEQRIVGETVLRSKDLRLTIDMKMDPQALTELLRLRQENNLENIAAVRTEPIELGE